MAYTVFKELERRLKAAKVELSPYRAAELTHTMYEIICRLPDSGQIEQTLLSLDPEQQRLWVAVYP